MIVFSRGLKKGVAALLAVTSIGIAARSAFASSAEDKDLTLNTAHRLNLKLAREAMPFGLPSGKEQAEAKARAGFPVTVLYDDPAVNVIKGGYEVFSTEYKSLRYISSQNSASNPPVELPSIFMKLIEISYPELNVEKQSKGGLKIKDVVSPDPLNQPVP